MSTDTITNDMDVIDSRDITERITDLDTETSLDDYDQEELDSLINLSKECSDQPDWTSGVSLIRESYFGEYARELAEDIGTISRNAQWPLGHIDWEAAADELKMDYFEVDFDGVVYYVHS